jgi:hypothetical protein
MVSRRGVLDRIGRAGEIAAVIAPEHATNRAVTEPVPEAIEAIDRIPPTAAKAEAIAQRAAAIAPRQAIGAAGPPRPTGVAAIVRWATFRPAGRPTCNRRAVRQASVDEAVALPEVVLPAGEAAVDFTAAEAVGFAAVVAAVSAAEAAAVSAAGAAAVSAAGAAGAAPTLR